MEDILNNGVGYVFHIEDKDEWENSIKNRNT